MSYIIKMNKYLVINGQTIKFPFKIEKEYIDKYLIMKRNKDKNILSMYL